LKNPIKAWQAAVSATGELFAKHSFAKSERLAGGSKRRFERAYREIRPGPLAEQDVKRAGKAGRHTRDG
jgi:hypothetical protein